MNPRSNLVWVDLEMTGLSPETDRIIEIATLVTDSELNVVAEGPVLAVGQPEEVLAGMDDWNRRTHGETGLTERVRNSALDEREAERRTLEFLTLHVEQNSSPMCGNSICQDRRFMARHMPELEAFFHYRNLDVSSVNELVMRWNPAVMKGLAKKGSHQAMEDIRDSIGELKHYREHFLRLPDP